MNGSMKWILGIVGSLIVAGVVGSITALAGQKERLGVVETTTRIHIQTDEREHERMNKRMDKFERIMQDQTQQIISEIRALPRER